MAHAPSSLSGASACDRMASLPPEAVERLVVLELFDYGIGRLLADLQRVCIFHARFQVAQAHMEIKNVPDAYGPQLLQRRLLDE